MLSLLVHVFSVFIFSQVEMPDLVVFGEQIGIRIALFNYWQTDLEVSNATPAKFHFRSASVSLSFRVYFFSAWWRCTIRTTIVLLWLERWASWVRTVREQLEETYRPWCTCKRIPWWRFTSRSFLWKQVVPRSVPPLPSPYPLVLLSALLVLWREQIRRFW